MPHLGEDNPGGGAILIRAIKRARPPTAQSGDDEGEDREELRIAAMDFKRAMEGDDPDELVTALQAFNTLSRG